MARPLGQAGALAVLEEAAHLLRRTPLETLLCHSIGSVPLAVMLLVFWNDATHPPMSDLACAAESLALALLLIWMNCWRSVFAGRLDCELRGAAEEPWNGARVARLITNQAFLAPTKLLLLPLSMLALLPFASTVSFYRNTAVLAGREELDASAVMARARRLARGNDLQSWFFHLLLLLLSLVTMLNVAIALMMLPQLVKMLTGYESVFTRSGSGFIENRLFLLVVLAATWLIFDPFAQAAHGVLCFHAESAESGEDLRAGLRRIRTGAVASAATIVLALISWTGLVRAADRVQPGDLEKAVRETMQSPEYNWRIPPPEAAASGTPWIIQATDRAIRAFQSALHWLGQMFDRLIRWIFGGLGLSPDPAGGQAPSAALHWSVWVLIGLAAAVTGWVLWRARRLRKKPAEQRPTAVAVRLDDEGLTADRLPESGWLELAEQCLADGRLRLALRAFYLANLAWLGRREFLRIDAGKTNREFEVELRRKARQSPEARALFSANVQAFERAWYGLHDVRLEDALEFQRRGEEIKARLGEEVLA